MCTEACILAYIYFQLHAQVCVCVHVYKKGSATITAHKRDSDVIFWSPSLMCQHPASHVVCTNTLSLSSLGTQKQCMFAYVCSCSVVNVHMFVRLLFLCIWVCAVRQVEGQVLMPAISSFLLPSPREKQACVRCPVNNHPSVLPDFSSICLSFHPPFAHLINFFIQ